MSEIRFEKLLFIILIKFQFKNLDLNFLKWICFFFKLYLFFICFQYRVLTGNVMSFLWSIYLASKRSWRLGLLPLDTHFKNQGKVLNKENWLLLKEFYDNHRNHPVHGINIKNLDCWSSLHNDEINYSVIRTKIEEILWLNFSCCILTCSYRLSIHL